MPEAPPTREQVRQGRQAWPALTQRAEQAKRDESATVWLPHARSARVRDPMEEWRTGNAEGDPRQCTAKSKQSGVRCRRFASPGSDKCVMHGSRSPNAVAKRKRDAAIAALEAEAMSIMEANGFAGGELNVEPAEVMLQQVRKSAWLVAKYEWLVNALAEKVDDDGDAPVIMDKDGVASVHPAWVGAGIAGRVDPDNWKTAPHVFVTLYNEERDRLMRYAKMCRDANVDERLVLVAQQQGDWLTSMLGRVFTAMVLTEDQERRLPDIIETIVVELDPAAGPL